MIDGVPLPEDARTAAIDQGGVHPAWAGVWVGSWDGILKHVLVIESVSADGSAKVVYAYGDNPWVGIHRGWSRFEGVLAASRLTLKQPRFSATYDLSDLGGLSATFTLGKHVSHAAMTKVDPAVLADPGAIIPWTRGKSEMVRTALVEGGKPVNLEVVMFQPPGPGPFPLAVFNHGSTGNGTNPALFTETFIDLGIADFLNDRGWIVAFPQRRGRGKSDGIYDEGFGSRRSAGYTCDFEPSMAGADRALDDIAAAIDVLHRRPDVAQSRVLIGGQSRGGILSVAYAGMHPDQIYGVINFVGGWMGARCPTATQLNGTLFERGGHFGRPTLWLYGQSDPFYPLEHSRNNFALFQRAGGQGRFLEFHVPSGNGHAVRDAPELWLGPVSEYLKTLAADAKR